jgi:peptide/nickel transport system ATP-binding protein
LAPLLDVRHLSTQFTTRGGVVRAVDDVSWDVREGETVALVGESGCGKSVSALSVMRLVAAPAGRIVGGEIWFKGRDLLRLSEEEMRRVRGREIAMIFQEPMTSLNPVLSVGRQLTEGVEIHLGADTARSRARAEELLQMVGIPDPARRLAQYPHQFSGGMRQRIMIAMALACEPALVLADEPTTALDVTIQAQILDLLIALRAETGMATVFISHDLGAVSQVCERVCVMYAGRIVEQGTIEQLFSEPRHPYTRGLFDSIPRIDGPRNRLIPIPGTVPNPKHLSAGCAFAPRCARATDGCTDQRPMLEPMEDGRRLACFSPVPAARPHPVKTKILEGA